MRTNIFLTAVTLLFLSAIASAQVNSNEQIINGVAESNAFLDGSTNFNASASSSQSIGKGLVFPTTDLNLFEFSLTGPDGITFPSFFDGMIVYNTYTGTTSTSGLRSSTATVVAPGFYYYSNPNGFNDYNNGSGDISTAIKLGQWLPLGGGSGVKSKTVTATADGLSATLPLTTLDDSDLVTFLGAKIYDAAGKLVMTADSDYDVATNLLNTGNGFMYQALAAGTYTVIVDYK